MFCCCYFFLLFCCAELSGVAAACLRVCVICLCDPFIEIVLKKEREEKNNTIGFSKTNKCTKCQKDKSNVNVSFWISLKTYRTCVKNRNRKMLMPAAAANKQMNKKMYQKSELCLLVIKISLLLSLNFFLPYILICVSLFVWVWFTHRLKFFSSFAMPESFSSHRRKLFEREKEIDVYT